MRAQFSLPSEDWRAPLESLGIGHLRPVKRKSDLFFGPIVRTRAAAVGGGMPTAGQARWAAGLLVLAVCKVLGISPELPPNQSVSVTLDTKPLTEDEAW